MSDLISIDGSQGEGGGQILRSALALAMVTGRPFRIDKIRSGRPKPGLLRQHLTALQAAAAVSGARVLGAELGAMSVTFEPGPIRGGEFDLAVGTAGSTTLVLQTILPALIHAGVSARVSLSGGTHNPFAPPYDFIALAFLPRLAQMGANVSMALETHGFYPAGGGKFTAVIEPGQLRPVTWHRRGAVEVTARAIVSALSGHIAKRELEVVRERLGLERHCAHIDTVMSPAGPGNMLAVMIKSEEGCEVITGFGAKGVTAEQVALAVCDEVERYLAVDAPIGVHLADQLLLPMMLAGGGAFRTMAPSAHTMTNIDVIRRFVDVPIAVEHDTDNTTQISVGESESRQS